MEEKDKINHVAIICDGNRRWATTQGLPKFVGHTEGAKNLETLARAAIKNEIPYLTLWGLSTENLKRSEKELAHLFTLFGKIIDYTDKFQKNDVRLTTIGDITRLPEKVQKKINSVIEATKNNKTLTLTLALVYGGRDEIMRATKKIIADNKNPEEINEELFDSYLDTADLPDVNLAIRTGGHKRLSGFLPWQTTYAELYFTDTFFPAFGEKEFEEALEWYRVQKQNFGK